MPKHVCEASICLSEGKYIDIQCLLRIFASTVTLTQKKLYKRQIYLAKNLFDLTQSGFLRHVLNVFCFSSYRIAEITVEFFVTEKECGSVPNTPSCFQLVGERVAHEHIRQASIKVFEADSILAEFRVGEKLISTLINPRG